MLLVQEFVTRRTSAEKHRANARDLDRFIARLSRGAIPRIVPVQLYGPVTEAPLIECAPPLFIGKAECRLNPAREPIS